MFHNTADQHHVLDHTTYNLSTTCSNQFWLCQDVFWENCASRRHIKTHPGKYLEMNFHQGNFFSFQVCGYLYLCIRGQVCLTSSVHSCVFSVRDDEENIALAQAWDKCNFSIRWHFASSGIPLQCLHRRNMLCKKMYFWRCWLFILRQRSASLVFSDLATRWVVYWIRSAGEPGEKIAELGQIFTNQSYLFWYLLSYLYLFSNNPCDLCVLDYICWNSRRSSDPVSIYEMAKVGQIFSN